MDKKLLERSSSKRKTASYIVTPEKSRHSMGSLNAQAESDEDGSDDSEYRTNPLHGSILDRMNLPVITEESEDKEKYKNNTDIEILST